MPLVLLGRNVRDKGAAIPGSKLKSAGRAECLVQLKPDASRGFHCPLDKPDGNRTVYERDVNEDSL